MTAAATAKAPAGAPGRTTGPRADALAGTAVLVRFNLRRDRVRTSVWIAALLLGTLGTLSSLQSSYDTAAKRASAADSLDSPAGLALSGPAHYLNDYTYGAMLGHQLISFLGVLIALMSVLMVTRHTRTEEETGRAELLRATVVGRHAHLTAALLTAGLANLVLGLLTALGLGASGAAGVGWHGSLLFGAVYAATGIVFAAIAAVTVQFSQYSRGASGMALAALGAAFALRAVGDAGSGALSWLSPIGWGQRTYVYVDNRWWPLLLSCALAAAATALAYALSVRRDVGAGLRATRPGSPVASAGLLQPVGFALRLHLGMLIGFGTGLLLLGAMYGSVLSEVEKMIEDVAEVQESLEELGGASITESFASSVMTLLGVVAALYAVLAALRPQSEETAGRAEPLLATGLSRDRWLGSHLTVALAGGLGVLLLGGLGFGLAGAATTGDGELVVELTGAAMAYAPAVWFVVGVAVVLYGWLPRATVLSWVLPGYAFVVGYLGQLLGFADWLRDLSPLGHVPMLPAAELEWTPLVVLTLLAGALVACGLAGFRRRDLETK
ncbi:ABC transporter permease [Streptomyces oceani]|uniref:ABC transporter permease n=1 Tax=Streptomyces oceani TaxID=1075402 RepID=A0A1E7JXC8_9ACTN|nr:ABC transporter permease [Streptomyces oceani]OEU96330.1 ABC transporter permease [Streptomyces oceani]